MNDQRSPEQKKISRDVLEETPGNALKEISGGTLILERNPGWRLE